MSFKRKSGRKNATIHAWGSEAIAAHGPTVRGFVMDKLHPHSAPVRAPRVNPDHGRMLRRRTERKTGNR